MTTVGGGGRTGSSSDANGGLVLSCVVSLTEEQTPPLQEPPMGREVSV